MDESNRVVNPVSDQNLQVDGVTEDNTQPPTPAAGDKTPANLLLKSLQEEREKRRLMEEELELLKSSTLSTDASEEAFSDEGKLLEKKIADLAGEVTSLKQESAKKDVLIAHPELKDKWDDLETFRSLPDNKGMNLRTAAKAYLIENGIFDQPRKGLETATGGTRQPLSTGMTPEDVKKLRETNYRKYVDMVQKGQIPNMN